jgi:hypothetical protein
VRAKKNPTTAKRILNWFLSKFFAFKLCTICAVMRKHDNNLENSFPLTYSVKLLAQRILRPPFSVLFKS